MKTRSKGTLESGLRRNIARVPSNRDHEYLKPPVDLTKTPAGKEIKLRTPKSREKRKAVTPRRDDLICSQHFDSQVVVGWDCNSPDSIRDLRKLTSDDDDAADLISRLINDEPDDAAVPKRNTPPLLGMWRDTDKDNQVEKNTLLPNRFKKRGRSRRKSAKDSVSQALLQKLEKALDKCSDTDKVTEVRSTEAELLLSDCDEEDEEETNANASDDLFEGQTGVECTTHGVVSKEINSKTNVEIHQNSEADADWSDDELFEDSFLVKPTQLSAETKKSQVFGLKRKPFRDSDLPQSKCSRVSGLQDNVRQPQLVPQAASDNAKGDGRFTAINAKQPLAACDRRFTMNSSKGNSYSLTGKAQANSVSNTLVQNFKPADTAKGVATYSVGVRPQNSLPCTTSQTMSNFSARARTDLVCNRNTTTQPRPMTSTNTVYSSNASGLSRYIGQATQNRPSAFKKHSSFSGTDSVSQSYASNRKRSISGSSNVLRLTKQDTSILEEELHSITPRKISNMNSVRTGHGDLKSKTLPSKPALNDKPRTVTSSASGSFLPIKNVTSVNQIRERSPRLYSNTFDTSLSDDLLCQLAEPDDILDSQIELTKPLKTTAVAPSNYGIKAPNARVVGAGNGNRFVKTSVVKPAKQSDSAAAQATVCKSVPPQNNQTKQYRFRDSQKSAASTSSVSSVLSSNISKVDTNATVSKLVNKPIEAPVSAVKKRDEKVIDEFDDDLFDDGFSDDDGLTEPQILAMLDEAELLATQQCANSSPRKLDQKSNNQTADNHGCISNSQGQMTNSQGQVTNSQGHVSNSQGQMTGSQGHLASSQDQNCSQTASQAKYSAEEIERKKREAIQKRKLRSQIPRT